MAIIQFISRKRHRFIAVCLREKIKHVSLSEKQFLTFNNTFSRRLKLFENDRVLTEDGETGGVADDLGVVDNPTAVVSSIYGCDGLAVYGLVG